VERRSDLQARYASPSDEIRLLRWPSTDTNTSTDTLTLTLTDTLTLAGRR